MKNFYIVMALVGALTAIGVKDLSSSTRFYHGTRVIIDAENYTFVDVSLDDIVKDWICVDDHSDFRYVPRQ